MTIEHAVTSYDILINIADVSYSCAWTACCQS